uniref:Uncharacterized protein n=1 Tax=Sphaerodactylus townsendi TaxID=933632 RepID=A0ACB8G7J1_9SAUR
MGQVGERPSISVTQAGSYANRLRGELLFSCIFAFWNKVPFLFPPWSRRFLHLDILCSVSARRQCRPTSPEQLVFSGILPRGGTPSDGTSRAAACRAPSILLCYPL